VNCASDSELDKTCNNNGVRDCGGYSSGNCESGVDCGNSVCGSCAGHPEENCGVPDHCTNGVKDQGLEEGVDCGGACPACGGSSPAAEKSDAVPVGEAGCPPDDCTPPPKTPPYEPPPTPPKPPYSCDDSKKPKLVTNGNIYKGCELLETVPNNYDDVYCCPEKPDDYTPDGVCCQYKEGTERSGELTWRSGISDCEYFSTDTNNYTKAETPEDCTTPPTVACPADYPIEFSERPGTSYECNTVGDKTYKNNKFCCRQVEPLSCRQGYNPYNIDYSFNKDYECYGNDDNAAYPWCCKYTPPPTESGCRIGYEEANATQAYGRTCESKLNPTDSNRYCCLIKEPLQDLKCPAEYPTKVTQNEYQNLNGKNCRAISSQTGNYIYCCSYNKPEEVSCPESYTKETIAYGHSAPFDGCYYLDDGAFFPNYCCPKNPVPIIGPLEIGIFGDLFKKDEGSFGGSNGKSSDTTILEKIKGIFVKKAQAQQEVNKAAIDPGSYTVDILNSDYKATTKKIDVSRVNSVVFYFDDNQNGVKDPEEPYLTDEESNLIQLSLNKVADIQTYNLNIGWNLISIPMVMHTEETSQITTASQLLKALNEQGAEVTHIAAYRNGKFLIYSQRQNSDSETFKYGEDFTLLPGEGYVVKTQASATVALKGNKVDGSLTVVLNPGWNLTGIYNSANDYYDAVDVLGQMQDQLVDADAISKFEDGGYKNLVISDGEQYGFTYNIYPEIGYFVRVQNDTKVTFKPE
ncbi:hypothetical protein KC622_02445, partial [Candidatus Dojkabacteria bacterium]|nr:hypothetical protein [Candidatus Dojkabacteria bacterium]